MDKRINDLKESHRVARESWIETILPGATPRDNAEYRHMRAIETDLQRVGVYVVHDDDGVAYEGGE